MSRAPETIKTRKSRWVETARQSFVAAVAIGISFSSVAIGQQPPTWSPQPYTKPAAASVAPSTVASNQIPQNSLRVAATTEPATTLRWSKVEGAASSQSSGYSQSMSVQTTNRNVHDSDASEAPRVARSKVIKHNQLASRAEAATSPSSGWTSDSPLVIAASAQQPVRNARQHDLVDLASHESDAASPERMKAWPSQKTNSQQISLAPSTGSTRREWKQVQQASFQDENSTLELPKPPAGLPGIGSPAINQPRDAREQTPPSLVMPPSDSRGGLEQSPSDLGQPGDRFDATPRSMPQTSRAERVSVDCESLQKSIDALDIRSIAVDSSPKFVEGYKGSRVTSSKDEFVRNAPMRDWYGNNGEKIAFGKLSDYTRGQVVIETEDGEQVTYLYNRLSSVDIAYVADAWGVPVVCSLSDGVLEPRQFTETTMTFKASGSCHKPLYFEEPQLERYGHEWGPVVQPVISTANFVKNVAVLPYKIGIHPMNECQYPLGYYRPGECAPWTVGPVPISLRGALMQAGAVTGAAAILP